MSTTAEIVERLRRVETEMTSLGIALTTMGVSPVEVIDLDDAGRYVKGLRLRLEAGRVDRQDPGGRHET